MGHRNPLRFLAPLALIAAIVGTFAVVQVSQRQTSDAASTTGTVKTTQDRRPARRKTKARTYVVKSGDNLTIIAERTGVPLEQLQQLNPDLDAQSLGVGQKLRLSR
jgi:LysM repeat protein